MVDLGTAGFLRSFANAINNRGEIVGFLDNGPNSTTSRPFLWTETGGIVDLGTLGGGAALAINDHGQIVGGSVVGPILRNAFLSEAERVIEEIGRLTAIDGAVLLNRALALMAFGVILPVRQSIRVVESVHPDGPGDVHDVDFGSRGTRHRAAATYAAEHPGSVVFIASEDGQVSCLLSEHDDAPVRLWRLMTETVHARDRITRAEHLP
jgi:probable HAF family extracellular repeat protein